MLAVSALLNAGGGVALVLLARDNKRLINLLLAAWEERDEWQDAADRFLRGQTEIAQNCDCPVLHTQCVTPIDIPMGEKEDDA